VNLLAQLTKQSSVGCTLLRFPLLPHQVVAGTAMPEEYRNMVVSVLCNDCHARSEVRFHVVGHKCGGCGSYNTRRV
jgi:hypothetical protein